jgi:hypothetical protein
VFHTEIKPCMLSSLRSVAVFHNGEVALSGQVSDSGRMILNDCNYLQILACMRIVCGCYLSKREAQPKSLLVCTLLVLEMCVEFQRDVFSGMADLVSCLIL